MSDSPRSDDGYGSRYKESYAYQESNGKDDYGNPTYTAYSERYACQEPTGRDNYGNPTYNWYIWINLLFSFIIIILKKKNNNIINITLLLYSTSI